MSPQAASLDRSSLILSHFFSFLRSVEQPPECLMRILDKLLKTPPVGYPPKSFHPR
jgi:hypothetical protein